MMVGLCKYSTFLQMVFEIIQKILKYSLYPCARGAMLGDWKDRVLLPSDKILINNTSVAARILLIVSNWKSDYVPQKDEWLSKVWHIPDCK